jgi:septation ring formation regulator EzrA
MNTPIEPAVSQQPMARTGKAVKTKGRGKVYMLLFMAWTLLIAGGVLGAKMYTDKLRQQIAQEIAVQTEQQLQLVQDDYQKQIAQLKDSVSSDLSKMQGKIDSLNELLAFTKDSANSKTDNSNQLYTQLAEVKKKLDELKKNLDVLQ